MLFVDEKINTKRQYEFDFAKCVAIFAMITVHVYECISNVYNYGNGPATDLFDHILQFVSGPLTAPLFMIAMGVGIVYSSHRTCEELAKRGLNLFIFSYVLSVFRYVIIYVIISPSIGLFSWDLLISLLCRVDILQFAGLSFLLTALLKKLNVSVPMMGVIALLMQIAGFCLGNLQIEGYAQYFFGLFFFTDIYTFFPLLHWYIYPVIGIILAKYLRHVADTDRFYKCIFILATTILISLCFALGVAGYNVGKFYQLEADNFYHQDFISVLQTICVILIELSIFHYIRKLIKSERVLNAVHFLSNNLNTIYVFQWLIIGNAFIVFQTGYVELIDKSAVLPVGILVFSISVGLTVLWIRIKAKYKAIKFERVDD